MDGAFQWISDLIYWIAQFFPKWQVVPETHAGVKYVRGRAVPVPAGSVVIWWPFWTEVLLLPVVRQTLNLPSQALMTKEILNDDGEVEEESKSITVAGIVVFDVKDVLKACTEVHDLDEAIQDLALAAIKHVLWPKSLSEIFAAGEEIDEELRKSLRSNLRNFGVEIRNVFLSDVSTCTVLKHIGSAESVAVLSQEED